MEQKDAALNDGTLGENLRRFRDAAGLTQAELAEKLTNAGVPGMYSQTIAKIEGGKRALRFDEGVQVANALHIDPAWLLPPMDPAAVYIIGAESHLNAYVKARDEATDRLFKLEEDRRDVLARTDEFLRDVQAESPSMAEWLEKVRTRVAEDLQMPVSDYMQEVLPEYERQLDKDLRSRKARKRK